MSRRNRSDAATYVAQHLKLGRDDTVSMLHASGLYALKLPAKHYFTAMRDNVV